MFPEVDHFGDFLSALDEFLVQWCHDICIQDLGIFCWSSAVFLITDCHTALQQSVFFPRILTAEKAFLSNCVHLPLQACSVKLISPKELSSNFNCLVHSRHSSLDFSFILPFFRTEKSFLKLFFNVQFLYRFLKYELFMTNYLLHRQKCSWWKRAENYYY